jgi:HEAT repeat protein
MPVEPLLSDARDHEFRSVRIRAIRTLGELKDASAVDLLKQISADPDRKVAQEAASALEKIGLDMWKRSGALLCLGKMGSIQAVEPAIRSLKDPNRDVRVEAARALGLLKNSSAIDPLLDCLGNSDSLLRKEAIYVLSLIGSGNKRVVDALIEMLKDESNEVRSAAAKALGRLADCSALDALREALEDHYWSVRRDAQNSMNNLLCLKA